MTKDAFDRRIESPTDTAWTITSKLIAGMVIYGGLGWLLSLWLGHSALFIAGGTLLGLAAAMYLVLSRLNHETAQFEQRRNVGADAK
jgi:F0F1-type ATP synthase assembly protein I